MCSDYAFSATSENMEMTTEEQEEKRTSVKIAASDHMTRVNKKKVTKKVYCNVSATISNISLVDLPTLLTSFAMDCHTGEWCGSAAVHFVRTASLSA